MIFTVFTLYSCKSEHILTSTWFFKGICNSVWFWRRFTSERLLKGGKSTEFNLCYDCYSLLMVTWVPDPFCICISGSQVRCSSLTCHFEVWLIDDPPPMHVYCYGQMTPGVTHQSVVVLLCHHVSPWGHMRQV